MADISDDEDALRELLRRPRRIAMVGASANPERPSHGVMKALLAAGHDVLPVNPGTDEVLGRATVPDLAAAADHWSDHDPAIEVVDVFRRPEHLAGVVDEAIEAGAPLVWCQLGVAEDGAVQKALDAGLDVVVEHCMKVEQARLGTA